ncbi:hypothetical protein GALL_22310 [mine drainage metagenome]|uniref:DUF4845 domain-containing protein n=1 Tax=mine drainage metagenome TaxID=410659 RepID=A0A1J5T8J8_9ZZZZ
MKAAASRQGGIGFVGFIMVAIGVVFVAIAAMKLGPAYAHSAQIAQIFKAIANDPAMQDASIKDIKDSYYKRANINYITDITADDIDISKENGRLILSTSYSIKIPIAGNVTLLLEFNPSSS